MKTKRSVPAGGIVSFGGSAADKARVLRSWRLIAHEHLPLGAKVLFVAVDSHTVHGRTERIEEQHLLERIGRIEEILVATGEVTARDITRERILDARRDAAGLVQDLWRLSGVGLEALRSTERFVALPAQDQGRAMAIAWQLINEVCADVAFTGRLMRAAQLVLVAVADAGEPDDDSAGDRITTAFCEWLWAHEEALLSADDVEEFVALRREVRGG
jgi:hypothetical protein